jgi:biopolymer transport protein ExbD
MNHRRKPPADEGGVNLGLVITPMLDMTFQLLAFFIMTYHPSALEAHIDGKLMPPATIATAGPPGPKKDEKEPPPTEDVDPDKAKETVRVIVKKVAEEVKRINGVDVPVQYVQIRVRKPQDVTDPPALVDQTMDLDKEGLPLLKSELEKLRKGPGGGAVGVVIDADPTLLYEYFIKIQDTCKAAEFPTVGFGAPLPAGP